MKPLPVPYISDDKFRFVFKILVRYLKVIFKVVEQLVFPRNVLNREMESILLFPTVILYVFKCNDFSRMNLALSKCKQDHNLSLVSAD